jgi:hypothetical protein
MSIIKLTAFTGESPRTTPRLLPDTGAQTAQSVRLEDGKLAPYRKPFPIYQLEGAQGRQVRTIYRHLGTWLWWDKVVHAVPGPVAQDRLYYTGDGKPKMRVGSVVYDLALSAPTVKLTGAVTGTVTPATSATRLYVYTRVTQFGEESQPSPISSDIVVSPGNTVTLSGFQAAPAGRGFTKQRIYRSQTGSTGGANLYFIAERDDSTANFVDNIATDAFNEALPSLDWTPPPDGLKGLVALPNGMMAGYVGKDLYFTPPYIMHTFPIKYSLSANYDITGLAVSGSTLIVGTKGTPELVGGTSPETMVMEHLEFNMPCLNEQGMVDMGYSILYPSNDGLVMVQGGTPNLISEELLTRDQWQRLDPATLVCGQFYGRFYASYQYADRNDETQEGTLIFDITGSQPYLIRSQHRADAMFYDITDSRLYMVMGATVYEWDSLAADADVMTYRSKVFVTAEPTSFGVVLVETDERLDHDAILAAQAARDLVLTANSAIMTSGALGGALNARPLNSLPFNGDLLKAMPSGPLLAVNIYADDSFVTTITTVGEADRLPPVLARQWEIEATGNVNIQQITLAGTAQELRSA